jgi:hypothetical protein
VPLGFHGRWEGGYQKVLPEARPSFVSSEKSLRSWNFSDITAVWILATVREKENVAVLVGKR